MAGWQRRLVSWSTPLSMAPYLSLVPVWLHFEISFAKLPTYLWKFVIFNKIKSSRSSAKHSSIHFYFSTHSLYSCGPGVCLLGYFLSFTVYTIVARSIFLNDFVICILYSCGPRFFCVIFLDDQFRLVFGSIGKNSSSKGSKTSRTCHILDHVGSLLYFLRVLVLQLVQCQPHGC